MALQFYNEAITTAPESDAARIAEQKWLNCGQVMTQDFFCPAFVFGLLLLPLPVGRA